MGNENLTLRQQRWFASVREGLERDTGRSLAAWVEIARGCPETGHRARLKWFKETHGLLQNRASQVLSAAFEDSMGWDQPEALVDALWSDAGSRAIFEAIDALAIALPDTIRTSRKSYTAWSRKVQFAAARPVRKGGLMLGLRVEVTADPRLIARGSESWSEASLAKLPIASPSEVDERLEALLHAAWTVA